MKRVGILRGGRENYDISIWEGGNLIAHLMEALPHKWKPVDILVDRGGAWHLAGVPVTPAALSHRVDLVWNIAHQNLSRSLAQFSIPEIGMPENLSYLTPEIWRREAEELGLKVPRRMILSTYLEGERRRYAITKAKEVHERMGPPWVVGSLAPSQMGVHARPTERLQSFGRVANTFPELVDAIEDGASHGETIVAEELIPGERQESHTVSRYRGEDPYAFPGSYADLARELHKHLGARHYLQSEFTAHPRMGTYLTALHFTPDLRKDSNFRKLCERVGVRPSEIVEHILEQS